jgi:hypothetical protein
MLQFTFQKKKQQQTVTPVFLCCHLLLPVYAVTCWLQKKLRRMTFAMISPRMGMISPCLELKFSARKTYLDKVSGIYNSSNMRLARQKEILVQVGHFDISVVCRTQLGEENSWKVKKNARHSMRSSAASSRRRRRTTDLVNIFGVFFACKNLKFLVTVDAQLMLTRTILLQQQQQQQSP